MYSYCEKDSFLIYIKDAKVNKNFNIDFDSWSFTKQNFVKNQAFHVQRAKTVKKSKYGVTIESICCICDIGIINA